MKGLSREKAMGLISWVGLWYFSLTVTGVGGPSFRRIPE
jgi:hypothetical protein